LSENEEAKDDFFVTEESAAEKELRLAKELIKKTEDAVDSEEDEDKVLEKLQQEALERRGKLTIAVADQLKDEYPAKLHRGHVADVTCIVVSSDGKTCITGSKDCSVIVWDLQSGQKKHIIKGLKHNRKTGNHFDEVLCLALSDDSKFLVTGGKDRLIKLWDGTTYEALEAFKGHRDSITGLAFQRGRHLLFSASADRSVKVWNLDDMAYMDSLFGHTSIITDIDSYITERALTCGNDCSVRLWKVAEESQLLFHGQSLSIDCIRIVNHEWFVTGSQDGSLGLWKITKKKPSYLIQGAHNGLWVTSLAVLPNSDLVASGSYDGWINLYRFTGASLELKTRVECKGYINGLSFSRDGQTLVAAIGQDYKYGRWTPTVKTKFGFVEVGLGLSFRNKAN